MVDLCLLEAIKSVNAESYHKIYEHRIQLLREVSSVFYMKNDIDSLDRIAADLAALAELEKKIDAAEETEEAAKELEDILGLDGSNAPRISAKSGLNIEEVLETKYPFSIKRANVYCSKFDTVPE